MPLHIICIMDRFILLSLVFLRNIFPLVSFLLRTILPVELKSVEKTDPE